MVNVELPISVFICYGGDKGRRVADRIRSTPLDRHVFSPFLASPKAHDMVSSEHLAKIEQAVRNSHVMVVVHTPEIVKSNLAHREVKIATREGIPIIPFIQKGHRNSLFRELKKIWGNLEFGIKNPEASFDKLQLEIVRVVLRKAAAITSKETKP